MTKVLVVEDEADIREMISYILGCNGFHVTNVANAEEALALTKTIKFDLILLDWMLPKLDGIELCKILRSHTETRKIPIIMLTAKCEEDDILTGMEYGVDDYITKPFSPKVLRVRINALLRRAN